MFGRSKVKMVQASGGKISVSTIPMEFYAGANPVIKFKNIERVVGNIAAPVKVQPALPKKPELKKNAVSLFGNRTFLIVGAVGLFIAFLIGAGIYYWRQAGGQFPSAKSPEQNPPVSVVPVVTPPLASTSTEVAPPPGTTTTPESVPATTTPPISLSGGLIEFPSILLGDSADMDHDGLTDVEEELFGTDPGKPDTDGDTYNDGTEIYNLYSPTEYAPARLITTAYVKEFLNPVYKYKLYYPTSWAVGNVDQDYRDMLFSTLSGENIEVRVFDRTPGQTFEEWFLVNATGEKLDSLVDFTTVFGGVGKMRNDKLVYYLSDAEHFYVIVYHVTNSNIVNYRAVIGMMARSFRTPNESSASFLSHEAAAPSSTMSTSSGR